MELASSRTGRGEDGGTADAVGVELDVLVLEVLVKEAEEVAVGGRAIRTECR